jgi:hypothetical protein
MDIVGPAHRLQVAGQILLLVLGENQHTEIMMDVLGATSAVGLVEKEVG